MAASRSNSAALMSDAHHRRSPSSPPSSPHAQASFMTIATEDDDTKMAATPDPSDKHPRGKKRGREELGRDGNPVGKVRHLKKDDGEPLWRKDIQYDFLKAVFDDEQRVFTNSYEPGTIGKQCFADLYIDTMSRSSKTSKVLRDKLLSDREAAKGMAMVCLLVNIGRMNTTLNFFPEMRAQLRTYHAIPSLQAHQDPHAYKQLQDAPRLKSILKGGAEDRSEPNTLDDIKFAHVPRTNPVNLLFVICQNASKIAELHFPPGKEFHDLIMKTNLSSKSRAQAFLWIMWFYLESDFTEEGCEENPFGAGVDYGLDVANQGVPKMIELSPEEEEMENADPQEEIDFGFAKQKLRAKIIAADQQFVADSQTKRGSARGGRGFPAGADEIGPTTGILPRIRPSKHESDMDSVRSTPPPRSLARQSGAFGSTSRRGANPLKNLIFEGSSPGGGQMIEGIVARKPRPPTAHQLAVERNRSQRVEYILDRGIRRAHHACRKVRRGDGSIVRVLRRLEAGDQHYDPFDDSESEDTVRNNKAALAVGNANVDYKNLPFREKGYGGLCQLKDEPDDFGEQFASYSAALRRTHRRLSRWEGHDGPEPLGVIRPVKRPKLNGHGGSQNGDHEYDMDGEGSPSKDMNMSMDMSMSGGLIDPAETEDEAEVMMQQRLERTNQIRKQRKSGGGPRGSTKLNGGSGLRKADRDRLAAESSVVNDTDTHMDDAEDLDEEEKVLLGLGGDVDDAEEENGDGEEGEDEDGLDDVEKTLLGMDGDSDSD
ncbi:hypothetical protein V8F06_003523 [Rhypophila decipiens]